MIICTTISELTEQLNTHRRGGKTIGFVPTMGALHNGHISLITRALSESDIVVCSIFVNPTQFNNPHDLAIYPRTLETDSDRLNAAGCHYVFAPNAVEMYPIPHQIKFDFGSLEHVMEGKFRPGHFNGVGLVVSKLFNIVKPDIAFFGQKDIQQCAVINRLIIDLSFPIKLVICPTEREKDGLAMSSRNRNLTDEQRSIAPNLHKNMLLCHQLLIEGVAIDEVKILMQNALNQIDGIELEYFEIVDRTNLESIDVYKENQSAICIAAFLGKTRLIDNLLI
ncbi:MAG: pantoate--beta-alanine ligase [Bacteroidota bacterium]